jgi:hypothetical protein
MKTFSAIKTNVGNAVQDTSTTFNSLIGVWVNNRYRDVINSYDWEQLYYSQTVNSSAAVSAYPLDENTERIIFAVDRSNDGMLGIINEQDFLNNYYDVIDSTGTPDTCFLVSEPVKSQPASAERILVKSSSASDTTQTVLLRGITNSGGETYESLTLGGTTPASAVSSYTRILGLSKSAATAGKITIYENDGTTILAEMSPETLVSRYKILHVYPIPDAGLTYNLRTKRRVTPLSQNYDYPIIEDVDDIIELGAQADSWRYKRQFSKANVLETQYQVMKGERIHREVAQPGIIHQFQPQVLDRDDGIL